MSKLRTRTFLAVRRLGDYELLRKIGSGGMAEVWMGRRAAMAGASKAVAIKLLAPNVLDDPAYREMFMEEARLSMLLTNSNVVQVFDVGEIKGECFMVMEWVDGLNLSELSRKMLQEGERLSVGVVAHIVGEVLRGLSYAHGLHHEGSQATIVHRDVSPHNVLVSVSGEVKLADFGVARLAQEETSGLHVKGKLRYMAPEQLRGRSRDPKVDLYAVGAILHELLAGERFRATRDEADLYSMVLTGEHPPLTVEVPVEIEALRSALLEPDPDKRVQSANAALELLHRWPGYRNHALDLAKLIRRWIGVGAPRSGIVSTSMAAAARRETGPSTASAAATVPADTRPVGPSTKPSPDGGDDHDMATVVEAATHADSGPSVDRGVTETRTFVEPETTPSMGSMVPPRAVAPSMLIAVVMTLALSFGIFGLGFPLGWWGGGDAQSAGSQVAIAPEVAGPVTPEHTETGDAETSTTKVVEIADPGEESGGEESDTGEETGGEESDTGEETGGAESTTGERESGDGEVLGGETDSDEDVEASDPPPEAKAKAKPATVVLKTGDFTFVYVKIGGKVQALEPTGTVKLKPGTHKVFLRLDEADPWKPAGKVEVEAGKHYTLWMTKPAGFELR